MKPAIKPLIALMSLASTCALAEPMYYDVGAAGGLNTGDPDSLSDVFSQLEFYSQVTTQHFDSDASGALSQGDQVSTSASGAVIGLVPAGGSEQVTGQAEITFGISSVGGSVASVTVDATGSSIVTTQFDANSVFNFYYEYPRNQDFGTDIADTDNSGFGDGSLVMSFVLDAGQSALVETYDNQGDLVSASYTLTGIIDFALDGFWSFAGPDGVAGTADDQDVTGLMNDNELIIAIVGDSLRVATEDPLLALAAGDPLATTHFDWQPLMTGAVGAPHPAPEPSGLWLVALGGGALLYARRRAPVKA
jgi:hypothetical protein